MPVNDASLQVDDVRQALDREGIDVIPAEDGHRTGLACIDQRLFGNGGDLPHRYHRFCNCHVERRRLSGTQAHFLHEVCLIANRTHPCGVGPHRNVQNQKVAVGICSGAECRADDLHVRSQHRLILRVDDPTGKFAFRVGEGAGACRQCEETGQEHHRQVRMAPREMEKP